MGVHYFGKKQYTSKGDFWVEAKKEDVDSFKSWSESLL